MLENTAPPPLILKNGKIKCSPSDFGLARDVYNSDYYKVHGEDFLPLRWLAPECIMEGVFSSKSDVWAFGILMYEIVGLGQKPYPSMENSQVTQSLQRTTKLQIM
ncbi:hypothetical protein Y032_0075g931 [Ancylostoma ceylanicum]|uniref:Protein kinase domain-containing protein n=1 Tax=Ancylostoma ceylanicum TaxID=53326 RepID=A0A016TUN4_9BILA|nr:hypothetical protein Y032_0075g931 [Ancylostoma ceylanicum]